MKIQLFDIVSVAAISSYFVPLSIVLFKKLWKDPFFLLFAIYWSIGGLVNICDLLPFSKSTCYYIGVFYNMIDIPLILAVLYYTSLSTRVRSIIPFAAAAIICLEVIGVSMQGFVFEALKYPLGAGIMVVIVLVVMEILRYMQMMEQSNRQTAKMFVYAAVLFEYATFIVIYIFDYYVDSGETVDSYLIYYFSTLGAIIIASCGYLLFRKYEPKRTLIRE